MWKFQGRKRPSFALPPGPGQESVWDYPRPPAVAPSQQQVVVKSGDEILANSHHAMRVLETASPPTWYLPPEDVRTEHLIKAPGQSLCEWKGSAAYWALKDAPDTPVAWSYANPKRRFELIAGWLAFYPGRIECYVAGERVRAQEGGFYGGWITSEIVGPFKGEPGTEGW